MCTGKGVACPTYRELFVEMHLVRITVFDDLRLVLSPAELPVGQVVV